ncbi:MAG: restriction endonuclease [Nanoarchaeota archaeon]|nr:restriction endonuclease [Nanoarchaeota archaeon]MBU1320716.1 restriction endonuclease [Nanoarchaeota archaeon]MBU1598265.1 restriction endonuclease [Nanoarchaeota archaeon]MBU2442069.1 restriction endonuclease [Nanoarchaeota archaeon]
MKSPKQLGNEFEERVKNALTKQDYILIKKNQWMKNYKPEKDHATKREYDLVMYNTREGQFYVIECKAHFSAKNKVSLEQVVKFNHVSNNYGGRGAKKLIVTDTDLETKAKNYAQRYGIHHIDGKQLRQMEEKPKMPVGQLCYSIFKTLMGKGHCHLCE